MANGDPWHLHLHLQGGQEVEEGDGGGAGEEVGVEGGEAAEDERYKCQTNKKSK